MSSGTSPKMHETEKHSEIKSGQFMISKLDDSDSEKGESESHEELESSSSDRNSGIPAFDTLQSLFKSLSLAYVETVTSPRWSHFRGAGFALKQKVRLNNIIWREYHMQYIKQRLPVIVQFQVPSSQTSGIKTQSLAMDGRLWDRHCAKLSNEYRRWRTYYINHLRKKPTSTSRSDKRRLDFELPVDFPSKIQYVDDKDIFNDVSNFSGVGSPRFIDELMKDFDGSLDLFLDQPFPDPRDMSMLGNSDIMQPALTQLQPNSENYRSDLITGLLQQPAMPTITEDDYGNASNYQSSTHTPHDHYSLRQPNPPQVTSSSTFRAYSPPQPAVPREPEYCYAPAASKQFSSSQPPPPSSTFASKSLRFVDHREEACTPGKSRNNLALLNALLQKPGRGVRERHHSTSSASSPETAMVAAIATTSSAQFKRQVSISPANALIVDITKEQMTSPSSGMYLDESSAGFSDTSHPTKAVCDTLQQHRLPNLSESSQYNYQSSRPVHNRFSSAERMPPSIMPAPPPPPPPPPSSAAATPQAPRVLASYTAPRGADSQKLISHFRRSRSQYHPNPPPYRRPLPPPTESTKLCGGSISSAPELYTICPLPPTVNEPSDFGEEDASAVKPPSATTVLGISEVLKEPEEQDEVLLDEGNENEDTDFDSYVVTGTEGEEGGAGDEDDDEDIKSAFLVTPRQSSSAEQGEASTTACLHLSSTEQRRRLSMQSSLKILQELVLQNQEKRLGGERKVTSGHQTLQQQHNHHVHHQKTSKAAVLRDGAELIRSQRAIRDQLDAEINRLRAELDSLQESVNACCDKLPTSGAMSKQQVKSMKNVARVWFRNFVAAATEANWKFYIFSLIFTEVFETYCEKVCCSASREVLRRSTISWLEDHCDLPQLRKLVMQALCSLSTTTNVLQQPNLLPQQAREAASRLAFQSSPPPSSLSFSTATTTSRSSTSPSSVPHFSPPLPNLSQPASSSSTSTTTTFLPHL
ncbi:MLX-interacting protein [Echinococcus granulosus]|nr:MLX-interacting protein [Echinococcus granulosus]